MRMGTDSRQSLAVCLVQVLLNPLTVNLVGAAVTRERVHVASIKAAANNTFFFIRRNVFFFSYTKVI